MHLPLGNVRLLFRRGVRPQVSTAAFQHNLVLSESSPRSSKHDVEKQKAHVSHLGILYSFSGTEAPEFYV